NKLTWRKNLRRVITIGTPGSKTSAGSEDRTQVSHNCKLRFISRRSARARLAVVDRSRARIINPTQGRRTQFSHIATAQGHRHMKLPAKAGKGKTVGVLIAMAGATLAPAAFSQQVTFVPYIQLGDNGPFGPTDQIVLAWQPNETSPNASAYKVELQRADDDRRFGGDRRVVVVPKARVVDNYLAADPSLPAVAGAYGPHSNYTAVLGGLKYNT